MGYGKFGGESADVPCGKGEHGRNATLFDLSAEKNCKSLLFPAENPKRGGKGTWDHQPCSINYTFAGSPKVMEGIFVQGLDGKDGDSCMRGKKPKEREKYVIRLGDGTPVEVNREIYLEWYQSERRERYQKERDKKYGVCSLEGLEEKGYFPEIIANTENMTEEIALWNIGKNRLLEILNTLSEQDIRLVELLFFEEVTLKEVAKYFECSRKSIENRRQKMLKNFRCMIEKE